MISNLQILCYPLNYTDGVIKDAKGRTIIHANRDGNETPLHPAQRDGMLLELVMLLNEQAQKHLVIVNSTKHSIDIMPFTGDADSFINSLDLSTTDDIFTSVMYEEPTIHR